MKKSPYFDKLRLLTFLYFIVFLFAFSDGTFAEGEVSVTSFGATGNGKADETDFIQNAIDFQSSRGGGTVHFPEGTYLIDALKSIVLKDSITLEFEKGAILKALPNNGEKYEILEIHDVKKVSILGSVEIIGERENHMGTTGEWGFGISIRGSNDINVENVKISNCWGDGIYIGSTVNQKYNKNIKILNPYLINNRRQGISVISAINLNINNAKITNTNGTPPQSGIDIEPNTSLEQIKNVNISNLSTENNRGYGLIVSLKMLKGSTESVSIYVNTTDKIKDEYLVTGIENLNGTINISGYDYLSEKPNDTMRISGNSRYETAVAISKEGWNKAETVVLATGSDFPDALAGSPLAFKKNAPILLTQTGSLTKVTKNEIQRLGAKKVIILGSQGAVSLGVETELKQMGISIERIGGKNRYETAALIAKQLASPQAVLANGQNFPDVLSVSAYAAKNGIPILLTQADNMPTETAAALKMKSKTYVIGSAYVIGESVFKSLPNPVRYGGKDRYETSYQVNTKLRMGTGKAFIATGMNYPDGLTGSVLAAKHNAPILLVKGGSIPEPTAIQLDGYQSYAIFGGTGAVGEAVRKLLDQQ